MAFCNISKSNYFHNLSVIEQIIEKDKIAVVLKNNAYGHGLFEIGKLASEYGIKHAVVNTLSESKVISNLFSSILILQDRVEQEVSSNIIVTINSIEALKKTYKGTKIEIKVDTGMNRNGIMISEINTALDMVVEKGLVLHGIFTHFANAYINNDSIYTQKEKFDAMKQNIVNDVRFRNNDELQSPQAAPSNIKKRFSRNNPRLYFRA